MFFKMSNGRPFVAMTEGGKSLPLMSVCPGLNLAKTGGRSYRETLSNFDTAALATVQHFFLGRDETAKSRLIIDGQNLRDEHGNAFSKLKAFSDDGGQTFKSVVVEHEQTQVGVASTYLTVAKCFGQGVPDDRQMLYLPATEEFFPVQGMLHKMGGPKFIEPLEGEKPSARNGKSFPLDGVEGATVYVQKLRPAKGAVRSVSIQFKLHKKRVQVRSGWGASQKHDSHDGLIIDMWSTRSYDWSIRGFTNRRNKEKSPRNQ